MNPRRTKPYDASATPTPTPVCVTPPPVAPPALAATQTDVAALLAGVNLFSGLPAHHLRRLANLGAIEEQPSGTKIFTEGSVGDKVYIVLEGAVRISRQVPGMGEEALAVLQPPAYFGEMALIDDFPRSADATAHERCRLFVIKKTDLLDLLFVDRDLAYELLWTFVYTLSARLRGSNDKMTFLSATSRF